MKKLLIAVAVIALVLWVITWFRTPDAVRTSASRSWPAGMGPLEQAESKYKPQDANAASVKLTSLMNALPKRESVDDFVGRELSRDELTIRAAPELADVSAIRELLLHEPVVWKRMEGIGGGDEIQTRRTMQMTAARTLVADALVKARANDAAAWDDLHAVWTLARSNDGHPQVMAQTASLTMARMVNAAAWKMPLPAPAWFAEVQERDDVRPLLEAYQHQTASYANDGMKLFPTKMLAGSVDHDRAIAEELANEKKCDVNTRSNELGVDLRGVWRRAFRFRAEREATANAMRIREGKPIEATSRCSDGAWTFDGTTLHFPREIATAPPDRPMPLTLRVITPASPSS